MAHSAVKMKLETDCKPTRSGNQVNVKNVLPKSIA